MHCQLITAYVTSEYLKLLAAMQDRVSANNMAVRTVAVLHPEITDIECFSHTIDHVGEHIKTPHLHEFGI